MPIDLGNLNISIQQFQAVSRGKYNAGDVKLASSNGLANGSLKPLFAVALAKACDDAGLANTPPAEKIARFAPDQPAGAALAQSLGALPPGIPVTPRLLQSLAAGALRQ